MRGYNITYSMYFMGQAINGGQPFALLLCRDPYTQKEDREIDEDGE